MLFKISETDDFQGESGMMSSRKRVCLRLVSRYWNTATRGREEGGNPGTLELRKGLKQELKPIGKMKRTSKNKEKEAGDTFIMRSVSLCGRVR